MPAGRLEQKAVAYSVLKLLHELLAAISLAGFILRWSWRVWRSPLSTHPLTRTLPHVVDTLFLIFGVALAWNLGIISPPPAWLWSKLAGLVLYILLGATAMRTANRKPVTAVFFILALVSFGWIVSVAVSKSPAGVLG